MSDISILLLTKELVLNCTPVLENTLPDITRLMDTIPNPVPPHLSM